MSELQHLTASQVAAVKVTAEPLQRTATGYGPKLPTRYMLKVGTRWHRVYVVNYGNAGSTYVVLKGQDHYLSAGVEFILETVRGGGTLETARDVMASGWTPDMLEAEGLHQAAAVASARHRANYDRYAAKLQEENSRTFTASLQHTIPGYSPYHAYPATPAPEGSND